MSDANGSFNGRSKFRNVTLGHPCPVCTKPDWCSVSEDGDVCLCRRQGDPSQQRTDTNGDIFYYHRLRPPATEPKYSLADGGGRLADADTRHEIYYALLQCLKLYGQHEAALNARGLKDGLKAAGYRSLPERGRYKAVRRLIEAGFEERLPTIPGFFVAEQEGRYWTVSGGAGLLIPVRDCQERIVALLVRPDLQGVGAKYLYLSSKKRGGPGPGAPIHVPLFKGEKTTVRISEGALKADVATRLSGILTIGLPGVNSGSRVPKVLKELGAKVARVALDADASRNKAVGLALYNLVRLLKEKDIEVELETWDEVKGKGIDDLLVAGYQPEVIQGDRVLTVAEGIASLAGAFNRPGSAPPDGANKSGDCKVTVLDIITKHFCSYFRPTFRRGGVMYSEAFGREIRASDACSYGATPALIDALMIAADAPRGEGGVIRSSLPKCFKTWAPIAWRAVLDSLQEEETSSEITGSAEQEFRAKVAAGLHTHVSLGYRHEGTEETEVQRRSLIAWADLFSKAKTARPGTWGQVRNYLMWCRRDNHAGPLRVALRVGLFASGQAHLRGLAEEGQYRFAQLCEKYGVGAAQRACGQRVVELAPGFIAELLAVPVVEQPEQPRKEEPGDGGGNPPDNGGGPPPKPDDPSWDRNGPSGSYLGGH